MKNQFPCRICTKQVNKNQQSIQCDKCDFWVHAKCNKINKQTFNFLQQSDAQWFCKECINESVPFCDLDDQEFAHTVLGKKISK